MPIVVEVKSKADYAKWAAAQKQKAAVAADDPTKAMDDGGPRRAAARRSTRRTARRATSRPGKGVPNAFPALDGSKVVLGPQADQIHLVLNGKPGTAMASFKQLSERRPRRRSITYTRNAGATRPARRCSPPQIQAARK